jgi:uncharacterized protein YneF (UPF0154 family)
VAALRVAVAVATVALAVLYPLRTFLTLSLFVGGEIASYFWAKHQIEHLINPNDPFNDKINFVFRVFAFPENERPAILRFTDYISHMPSAEKTSFLNLVTTTIPRRQRNAVLSHLGLLSEADRKALVNEFMQGESINILMQKFQPKAPAVDPQPAAPLPPETFQSQLMEIFSRFSSKLSTIDQSDEAAVQAVSREFFPDFDGQWADSNNPTYLTALFRHHGINVSEEQVREWMANAPPFLGVSVAGFPAHLLTNEQPFSQEDVLGLLREAGLDATEEEASQAVGLMGQFSQMMMMNPQAFLSPNGQPLDPNNPEHLRTFLQSFQSFGANISEEELNALMASFGNPTPGPQQPDLD